MTPTDEARAALRIWWAGPDAEAAIDALIAAVRAESDSPTWKAEAERLALLNTQQAETLWALREEVLALKVYERAAWRSDADGLDYLRRDDVLAALAAIPADVEGRT